jgi:hypothetical protein
MKDISTEIIEIDGKEYTLFLNRKGIVAYEKYCIEEDKKMKELETKYSNFIKKLDIDESPEIKEDTNPFEDLDEFDDLEEDAQVLLNKAKKLYWIMLYEHHHLSFNEVCELFDKAVKEYGETQVVQLGEQMVDEVQENKYENTSEIKNLKALKPKK